MLGGYQHGPVLLLVEEDLATTALGRVLAQIDNRMVAIENAASAHSTTMSLFTCNSFLLLLWQQYISPTQISINDETNPFLCYFL